MRKNFTKKTDWPKNARTVLENIDTGHHALAACLIPDVLGHMAAVGDAHIGEFIVQVADRIEHLSYAATVFPSLRCGYSTAPVYLALPQAARTHLFGTAPKPGTPAELLFSAIAKPFSDQSKIIRRFLQANPPDQVYAVFRPLLANPTQFWCTAAGRDPDLVTALTRQVDPFEMSSDILSTIVSEAERTASPETALVLIDAFARCARRPANPDDVVEAARRLYEPSVVRLFFEKAIQPVIKNLLDGHIARLAVQEPFRPVLDDLLGSISTDKRVKVLNLLDVVAPEQIPELLPFFARHGSSAPLRRHTKSHPSSSSSVIQDLCVLMERAELLASTAQGPARTPSRSL